MSIRAHCLHSACTGQHSTWERPAVRYFSIYELLPEAHCAGFKVNRLNCTSEWVRMHLPIANHWIDQYLYFDYIDYKLNPYCIRLAHSFSVGFVLFSALISLTCSIKSTLQINNVCASVGFWTRIFHSAHAIRVPKPTYLYYTTSKDSNKKLEYHQMCIWYLLLSIRLVWWIDRFSFAFTFFLCCSPFFSTSCWSFVEQ